MTTQIYKKMRIAEHSITGKRWCSQCQMSKVAIGGEWKEFSKGNRRRWECANCTANREKRAG